MQGSCGQKKSGKNCFKSYEKSGNLVETCRNSAKSQELLFSMQMNSLIPNRKHYTLRSLSYFFVPVEQRASFSYPICKNVLNYLVLKNG